MSALASAPASVEEVSPGRIVDNIFAFHQTAAIRAAIDLDLFTIVAAGSDTPSAIAAKTGAAERGVRILCDYLTVNGLLNKSAGGFALTPSAAVFLDRRSPAYMGEMIRFSCDRQYAALIFDDPAAYVRNGGSPGLAVVSPDNPVWVRFAEAMSNNPLVSGSVDGLAAEVAGWKVAPRKILDVAAGHGRFGITLAKMLPDAEIVAVDWASVLTLARQNAAQAGVEARYTTIAGSAFDVDWGGGYDLILLPNFLHHFDAATCTELLRKVRAGLGPDGIAVAVEFVASEDGVSTPFGATFAFLMLATTPGGDAYTSSGLQAMASGAGFAGVTIKPLDPSPASLVFFDAKPL